MLRISALSVLTGLFVVYSWFVYTDGTSYSPVTASQSVISGKKIWQKYNCTACHQIYGLGGYLGPDLTNVIKIKGRDYASAIIKSGPRSMPVVNMSDEEMKALLDFLEYTGKTGNFPNREIAIDFTGSFHINNTGQ